MDADELLRESGELIKQWLASAPDDDARLTIVRSPQFKAFQGARVEVASKLLQPQIVLTVEEAAELVSRGVLRKS